VTSVTKEKLHSISKRWNCKSAQVKFTKIDKNSFNRIVREVGAILADHIRLQNTTQTEEEKVYAEYEKL